MCICLFILLQTYFQFRQLPCSAARQLCQMQPICLAATLVQGCHNEAKALFWQFFFKLKPQQYLRGTLLERWSCYLEVGGSSPGAETFACVSRCHCTANIFQFRQLPRSPARQLCQMQRICLAATLVQGCPGVTMRPKPFLE